MAIFAMAALPINACACSHHEAHEVESAAHENSCGHGSEASGQPDEDLENADSGDQCKNGADCACARSTEKTATKSETAKVNIHAAALLSSHEKIEVVKPSHLSRPLITPVSTLYR